MIPFPADPFIVPLKHAKVEMYPNFLSQQDANLLLNDLITKVAWEQNRIRLFGKTLNEPRLTAFFSDDDLTYTYSGTQRTGLPFPKIIHQIRKKIEKVSESKLNSCLLNYYRHGEDSMGWHSDDEKELGRNPTIVSLSLGAERVFHIKSRKGVEKAKINMTHGSLLVMHAPMQSYYLHQIPKSKRIQEARISLTFRKISNSSKAKANRQNH